MNFEWDEQKRQTNIRDHAIDFYRAAKIFRNPTYEDEDFIDEFGEQRYRAIGQWEGNFMVVIYVWRGDSIRIISAWKASSYDREKYHTHIR